MQTAHLAIWEKIYLGVLLHDIGKVWQRGGGDFGFFKHEALSSAALDDLFKEPVISIIGAYHHKAQLEQAIQHKRIADPELIAIARLAGEADNLASGERKSSEQLTITSLESIFNLVNDLDGAAVIRYFQPICRLVPEAGGYVFPEEISSEGDQHQSYQQQWTKFYQELSDEIRVKHSVDLTTIYFLCKKHLWCIPAAYYRNRPDISLFEHSRLAAAIAVCQYRFLIDHEEKGPAYWPGSIIEDRTQMRYMLVCGDFAGIQRFIYDIAHKGALKALKGRSFLLQQILDHGAQQILESLELPQANLLYCSGGKFYLLLPNSQRTNDILNFVEREVNEKLLELYGGASALVFARLPLAGSDFVEASNKFVPIGERWDQINTALATKEKFQKFRDFFTEDFFLVPALERAFGGVELCYATGVELCTLEELSQGKRGRIIDGFREIELPGPSCKQIYEIPEEERPANLESSYLSKEQYEAQALGKALKGRDMIASYSNRSEGWATLGDYSFDFLKNAAARQLTLLNSDELTRLGIHPTKGFRFYGGNWQLDDELPKQEGLEGSFEYWEKQATGISYLAVLRMDVDNLGLVFQKKLQPATISRIVQLSSMLDFFFSGYLNRLKDLYWSVKSGVTEETAEVRLDESLQIVYSGGDDVFIVGRWDVVPDVALWIQREFSRFVGNNPNLSISAGIALFHAKQPLYKVADLAGEAEALAKGYRRLENGKDRTKNAICFLGNAVSWQDFEAISTLTKEWYGFLKTGLSAESGPGAKLPKAFLRMIEDIFAEFLEVVRYNRLESGNNEVPAPANIKPVELEPARYGPWRWRAAYRIKRMGDRYRDYQPYLHQLSADLFLNHRSEKDYLLLLNTAAQWADYLTREK